MYIHESYPVDMIIIQDDPVAMIFLGINCYKINDKPKEVCPKCNKKGLKKQISAPSFRLKGGGWYETDFKTGKKKNIASSDGAKNDKTKETSKTDSKKGSKQDKIKK